MKALLDNSLSLKLPAHTHDGQARQQAMLNDPLYQPQDVLKVSYSSTGSLLVIGAEAQARTIATRLGNNVNELVIAVNEHRSTHEEVQDSFSSPAGEIPVFRYPISQLSGYLGNFVAEMKLADGSINLAELAALGKSNFDIVLDLSSSPLITTEVTPPGYFAPVGDAGLLEQALAEIPELIGDFEKLTYFQYHPSICAHGNSGLQGCTRCLTACPTQAIRSIGDLIEVEAHLCQGEGSCATTCPTGAITYTFPQPNECLFEIKNKLKIYRQQGGLQPCLLFHDKDTGRQQLSRVVAAIPENILPYAIEEIGAIGMDICLAALAYASSHVLILTTSSTASSVSAVLQQQVDHCRQVLAGLHLGPQRITLLAAPEDESLIEYLQALPVQAEFEPATFITSNEKRNTIRMALIHLVKIVNSSTDAVPLSKGAPFGEIQVDKTKCTLCMACVSVCPVSALQDHPDKPQLSFIEENCVQCELCVKACPEDAICLQPRITFDFEARRHPRTLHEEQPFCCIRCGKPFATTSLVREIENKLKGHWMFQNEADLQRLQMCEDCRVEDMIKNNLL